MRRPMRTMPLDQSFSRRANFAYICTAATLGCSLLILVGWVLDIAPLKTVVPGFPEMKPNTAIAFMIASFGIGLAIKTESNFRRDLSVISGAFVYLIGAITLGEYLAGASMGAPTMFFPASGVIGGQAFSGHMSPHTAFSLVLLGVSLIFLNGSRRVKRASEFFAVLLAITTYAVILGYFYKAEHLFGVSRTNAMAVPTVVLFFLCSLGLLVANPASETAKIATSASLGGSAMRRLLPAIVLVPTFLGWLRLLGQEYGLYDTPSGAVLTTFSSVVLMFCILLYFSSTVHRADRSRAKAERDLIEKEQRYRDLFDYSQGMISIHDLSGKLLTVNPATVSSLGYEVEEIVGRNLFEFVSDEHKPGVALFLRQIENEGLSDGLLPIIAKNGQEFIWRYHSILVEEPGKEPFVIGHAQDVTELIAAQKELKNLTLTDDLTGLYNRRGFLTMAEQQLKLERHEGTARGLILLFADMDGLKKINDIHGHEAGSEAIIALARIIHSALRSADIVARWGGDEFVVLTIGSNDENAETMLDRIQNRISGYNAASGKPYTIACSIGVAPIIAEDRLGLEEILAEADLAMYAEKRRRKAQQEAFSGVSVPHAPTDRRSLLN